jgi:hypothetical protein
MTSALAAIETSNLYKDLPPEVYKVYGRQLKATAPCTAKLGLWRRAKINSRILRSLPKSRSTHKMPPESKVVLIILKSFDLFNEFIKDRTVTINKSILKIAVKKWMHEIDEYGHYNDDTVPDKYMQAAFLMYWISNTKPFFSKKYPMINEVFAFHLGFNLIGFNLTYALDAFLKKAILHLYYDNPEPNDICSILKASSSIFSGRKLNERHKA